MADGRAHEFVERNRGNEQKSKSSKARMAGKKSKGNILFTGSTSGEPVLSIPGVRSIAETAVDADMPGDSVVDAETTTEAVVVTTTGTMITADVVETHQAVATMVVEAVDASEDAVKEMAAVDSTTVNSTIIVQDNLVNATTGRSLNTTIMDLNAEVIGKPEATVSAIDLPHENKQNGETRVEYGQRTTSPTLLTVSMSV